MKGTQIITTCLLLCVLASCSKKDENLDRPLPPTLGGDTWTKGPIDFWLYDSLTKPFNIEVKYRWDPWENTIGATLVPPREDRVIPAMSAIKQIWIDPYNQETGSDAFIKKYAPKQFVLVGSAEYFPNGTIKLGEAEGGNKIQMYVINEFDKNNIGALREMLHTIQHEFAHILHQNVMYPIEFKNITGGYTATWFNVSNREALSKGYITSYAMSKADDDFVEMIATMLVEGKDRYEELVASTNAEAQTALRAKEDIVVDYFRQVYNIDFYSLQQRTQEALNRLAPAPPITSYLGFDKAFTTVSVNPASPLLPLPNAFLNIYNKAKSGLDTVGGAGLVMDSIAIIFYESGTALLRINMHDPGGDDYAGHFFYTMTTNASGIYSFTYAGPADANGDFIQGGVKPLIDYFNNNTFRIDWFINPNNTIYFRALFTPQQTPGARFVGLMLEE